MYIFIANFLELKEKVLFNITRRGVGMIHMEEVFVLQEYGMEVTKHWYGQLFSNLFSLVLISFMLDLNICFSFD